MTIPAAAPPEMPELDEVEEEEEAVEEEEGAEEADDWERDATRAAEDGVVAAAAACE